MRKDHSKNHFPTSTSFHHPIKQFINGCLSFTRSALGSSYLGVKLHDKGICPELFEQFINTWRGRINNIPTLLGLLIVRTYDNAETTACKLVFKEILELFLKHFSLDWILKNEKTGNKMKFLRYRTKLIRKLQNNIYNE